MTGTPIELIKYLYEQDKNKIFDLSEHSEKRSINANNYCWALIGKISQVMNIDKEDVYKDYVKNRGIFRTITIDDNAKNTFITAWEKLGLGYICEEKGSSRGFTDIIAYYGTSSYNTKQMAYFIDYVVQEAQNLGIETKTEQEINELKERWEYEVKKSKSN